MRQRATSPQPHQRHRRRHHLAKGHTEATRASCRPSLRVTRIAVAVAVVPFKSSHAPAACRLLVCSAPSHTREGDVTAEGRGAKRGVVWCGVVWCGVVRQRHR
ncbi:hypothetical protein E2C01_054412 [Portunus trituberculatus]|uniref:Uncharacterized protein n=1 Tax=Portunus trituberculatus TaxID=210409 RepID=A0A5B7GTL5_PORTR|nr:hypothetical protein [Portunus trituberculatus]